MTNFVGWAITRTHIASRLKRLTCRASTPLKVKLQQGRSCNWGGAGRSLQLGRLSRSKGEATWAAGARTKLKGQATTGAQLLLGLCRQGAPTSVAFPVGG
jgi:hypothetical protein